MKYILLFAGLAIFLFLPAKGISQNVILADSLNKKGMAFYDLGNYRQAEFYLGNAFHLYEKYSEPSVWLSPGIDYAEILVDRSKYDQALSLFKKLKETALTLDNISARARIENDLGWTHNMMGKNDLALVHLQQAIPLAEQAQDTLRLGFIYNNIGSIYYGRGDYKTALDYWKKALFYKEKTNDKQSVSITLNNIGIIYRRLSLYDKALDYNNKALAIRKELNNADLLASTYGSLAGLYRDLGNFNQALVNYHKSLDLCKKAGNPKGTANILNNIGALYSELGDPKQALEYYRQSLQLKEQFAGPASMALAYTNIASRIWSLGRYKEAREYYNKALTLRRQTGNPLSVAASLLDLARINLASDNFTDAYSLLDDAIHIADSTENKSLQTEALMMRGDILFKQKYYNDALKAYNHSYSLSLHLTPSTQIEALQKLAYTYNQLSSAKAIWAGQKAITIIEKERSQVGPLSRLKVGYFKRYTPFYVDLASWILKYKPKDISQAYHLIEASKARSLTEELAKAAQQVDESLPEKERIRRAQMISVISDLYVSLKKTTSATTKKEIRKRIREKELDYFAYEHTLQGYYPQYKSVKKPAPLPLKKAQELCNTETAILEYAVTDNEIIIFFITSKKRLAKRISINKKENSTSLPTLSDEVLAFRKAILTHAPIDSIRVLSQPLYKQLIAPFEQELTAYKNLIIVPDQILAYLPFEALSKKNNYLISQYNIKYTPSITGYPLMMPPKDSINNILTISNSSTNNTPLLPSTDIEVKSIAQLFAHSVILKNKELAEDRVKSQLQQGYKFIHIASHSIIDEKNSSLSGVYLAKPSSASKEDGFLRSSEIYGLHISANLVVLSACESGLGQLVNGEGMLGLQRAFLNAGASSVVVSLWDVYDRSTSHFMPVFYKALMQSQNRSWYNMWITTLRWIGWDHSIPFGETAAAMRQAKLSMIQSPRYNHPVYWAPFIVIGR